MDVIVVVSVDDTNVGCSVLVVEVVSPRTLSLVVGIKDVTVGGKMIETVVGTSVQGMVTPLAGIHRLTVLVITDVITETPEG